MLVTMITHTFIRLSGGMSAVLSPPPVTYDGKRYDVGNQAGDRHYRNCGLCQASKGHYRNCGLCQAGKGNYRNGGLFQTGMRHIRMMRLSVYQAYGNTTQTACSQPMVLMFVHPLAMMPQFLRAPTLAPFPPFLRAPTVLSMTSSPM